MLCRLCTSLGAAAAPFETFPRNEGLLIPYHETFPALRTGVEDGCHLCSLILGELSAWKLSVPDDQPIKLFLWHD
jgi:hypothetical protein